MKYFITLLLCFLCCHLFSQSRGDSSLTKNKVFSTVEQNPKFKGGITNLYKFISENLNIDSSVNLSLAMNTISVRILIDKDGNVGYAQIIKGVSSSYDSAVLDMVFKMPQWLPAKQNGRAVYCYITLPIVIL